MEITPRRTLSLNFPSTYIIDRTIPQKTMWTEQNMKTGIDIPTNSYKMSHSLSMDDTRVHQNFPKKDNNILRGVIGIFGSLTNIVSRIPNFMSSINNQLSVTVVPNEGLISPEDLLKNLTRSSDDQKTSVNDSIKLFDRIQESHMYNKSNIAEIYAEKIANTASPPSYTDVTHHLLPKSWIEGFNDQQESFVSLEEESNDLNLAIQESLRHMKHQNNWPEEIIEENSMKIDENIPEIDENSVKLHENSLNIEEIKMESSEIESPEAEVPSKRPHLQKIKRKTSTVARSRGKSRSKFQLRKSGVSQSKHRKERTKQNLWSNIQDDLEAWEDNDADDVNYCKIEADSGDNTPDYPTFIETFVFDNHQRIKKRRQRKLSDSDCLKLSYRVRFLPDCSKAEDELLSSCSYDIRKRLPSESSIDSEDSCCIVFEDGSDSEYTDDSDDYVDYDVSEDEDDGEEEEKPGQKVRFNLEPKVHTMIQWNYAYRAARRGPWEEMARDRERFRGRINCIERVIDPVLTAKHRECIWHDRFAVDESINM